MIPKISRATIIVLDSAGVGYLPDAEEFGDKGANTFGHIAEHCGGLNLPNMQKLGLGNITPMAGVAPTDKATGAYGKAAEASKGKDTTTGHWEIAGVALERAFPTYTNGFSEETIRLFEERTGRKVLANKPASGTAILDECGEEQLKTGSWIVYTSADPVFQIAAHEELIHVIGIGKTSDIFAGQGITDTRGTNKDNVDGIKKTIEALKEDSKGLIFTNLVDFDMVYGHRRNPEGYGKALEEFDSYLPEIESNLKDDEILILTADHGCDPTYKGTDHTREYIPVLVSGKNIKKNVNLGTRSTFADIAATVEELLTGKKVEGSFAADLY